MSPLIPCVPKESKLGQSNAIMDNALIENFSGIGIDKIEATHFYDSSSATSCEGDDSLDDTSEDEAEVRQSQPAPELTHASKISTSFNGVINRKNASNQRSIALQTISKQDIPEYRQDLYKDCFTLFMENWFGKRL